MYKSRPGSFNSFHNEPIRSCSIDAGACASSQAQMLFIYSEIARIYIGGAATIITYDGSVISGIISGFYSQCEEPAYIVITVDGINYNLLVNKIALIDIAGATVQPISFNDCIEQSNCEIQLQDNLIGILNVIFIGTPNTTIANTTVIANYPGITVFTYTDLAGIGHVIYATYCSILAYS